MTDFKVTVIIIVSPHHHLNHFETFIRITIGTTRVQFIVQVAQFFLEIVTLGVDVGKTEVNAGHVDVFQHLHGGQCVKIVGVVGGVAFEQFFAEDSFRPFCFLCHVVMEKRPVLKVEGCK